MKWGNSQLLPRNPQPPSTASNVDIQGLTPGTVYLARTRAVGAKNAKGPWSQSVQRRAP